MTFTSRQLPGAEPGPRVSAAAAGGVRRARIDCWELQHAGGLAPGAETVISANGERVAQLRALSGDRIMITTDQGERVIELVADEPIPDLIWRTDAPPDPRGVECSGAERSPQRRRLSPRKGKIHPLLATHHPSG